MAAELTTARDLFAGQRALDEKPTTYLPQHPGEKLEDYSIRTGRRVLFNAFRRAVQSLVGMVFTGDPKLVGVPPVIKRLWEDDIDGMGTEGEVFTRSVFQDALIAGHAGILVDMPTVEDAEVLNGRDELERGIRPYWVHVLKDDIYGWRTETIGGRTILTQLVIREGVLLDDGEFGSVESEQFRVLRGNRDGEVSYEIWKRPTDGGEPVKSETGPIIGVKEIPFAVIYTDRTGYLTSRPPMIDLCDVNLRHYETASDYAHALHIAMVPVLFGKGFSEEDLLIGPNSAVVIDDAESDASLEWVETAGTALGSARQALLDMQEQMAKLGLGMLERQSRSAETAEAKSIDTKEQNSALENAVASLEDGLAMALWYTAQFLGEKNGGEIEFKSTMDKSPQAAKGPRRDTEPRGDEPDQTSRPNIPTTVDGG
jgi:hypothetical protein